MKIRLQYDKQTELISASKTDSYQQKLTSHLQQIGQLVINALFSEPEFKIRKSKDRQGNVWWYAYDPKTGHTGCLASEQEVRMWIEESFYRRNSRFSNY
jgi:hypothetical protein